MKAVKLFQNIVFVCAVALVFSVSVFAQVETPKTSDKTAKTDKAAKTEEIKPGDGDAKTLAEAAADEKEVLVFYNNYLKEYRLGPSDVISVEVFGQCPNYCKTGITVPPTARISYPLVREGVMVGGKTVEQVADEITKKLDEFIIDPKVMVTLDKAMSARYAVMGKVNAPGIRILDRKVSLYEAVIEAGGVAKNGNKRKIALVRFNQQGALTKQLIDLTAIESGKTPMVYLNPGDQVFVPSKGLTFDSFIETLGKVSAVRLLFGSPF
jgi:polysaccharide export outer membrane protein